MLVVDGRSVAAGRAWARSGGAVVRLDDVDDVVAVEDAGGWDHLVLVGPAGAGPGAATAAFGVLDDLLAEAGPALLFGGVDLPGRFRTAYADRDTAAGRAPALGDQRDAVLRALRVGDAAGLGPPMRVTATLFGPAATRRLGRALAAAVAAGRHDAVHLAAAAAGLLGPEKLEAVLGLEGAATEPGAPVGDLEDHLATVLSPFPEARRLALLQDLWRSVAEGRADGERRRQRHAFAESIAGDRPAEPTAWLRAAMNARLEHLEGDRTQLAFERPAWITTEAMETACREVAAATALVVLALAERDGGWDEALAAVRPIVDLVAAEQRGEPWNGPASRRLVTLAVEEANRSGGPRPEPRDAALLLWPPVDQRARLAGCGWDGAAAIEAVNLAAVWARSSYRPSGPWSSLLWQAQAPIVPDTGRTEGWTWRYDGVPFVRGPDETAEDVYDGLALVRLADLLGDLAGTGPATLLPGTWRFGYELRDDDADDPTRPLLSSVDLAVAGAAQLVRLGAEHPDKPTSWAALVDRLHEVVRHADPGPTRLPYPPELAALDGTELGATGLQIIVPRATAEIVGWGNWMGNCIATYVDEVRAGTSFVFALAHPGPRMDRPVHNLELNPGAGAYTVGELKARFNDDCPLAIEEAVHELTKAIGEPTRPWPPRPPATPRERRPASGRGSGAKTNRAARAADRARLEAAAADVLAGVDQAPFVAVHAGGAAAIVRLAPGQLDRRLTAAAVHLAATDWVGALAAATGEGDAAARRRLATALRRRRSNGPAVSELLLVVEASEAVGAAFRRLATGPGAPLEALLAPGKESVLLLAAALLRSAAGGRADDLAVPFDDRGLVTTRPHTDVGDPEGPWAAARRIAAVAGLGAEHGRPGPGELVVAPAWVGGSWSRWVARAAPALAAAAGPQGSGTARLLALAALPGTDPARLDELARRSPDLALLVATNPSTTPATLRRLAQDGDAYLAATAALARAGWPDAARWLAAVRRGERADPPAGDDADAWAAALPRPLRRRLADAVGAGRVDDPALRRFAAEHAADAAVLAVLAASPDVDVRCAVAANSRTPDELLPTLAGDRLANVRLAVAGRRRTLPAGVASTLARDPSNPVRAALGANPATAKDVLRSLEGDRADSVRDAVAANPRMAAELQQRAAADPTTEPARLEALATGPVGIRRLLAANPSTPIAVLARLAHLDPDAGVRRAAGEPR